MKQVISTERIPIKMWLDDLEDGALEQAKDLANLPFAFKHVAIMPDSHQGYGMPIGAVLATENVIIPNAVGVDIGCGMGAVRTNLKSLTTEDLKEVMGLIREKVPVGRNHHSDEQPRNWMPDRMVSDLPVVNRQYQKALHQIGTLGGGNHFIEIQGGSDGYIWIMIHSGSRNLGYTVANHYHKMAKALNEIWHTSVPEDLSFLPRGTVEYQHYFDEMNYCVNFALRNRELMLDRIGYAFNEVFDGEVSFEEYHNKSHNFASFEHHFDKNVLVHRKGATRAREGEIGMIPSSQGTPSYIVKGKGEPQSFESCSHGAGRLMSRTKAIKTLDMEAEIKALEDNGILHAIRNKGDLDEAPSSYKNIETVMNNQSDLVEILVELKPLGVIKG